MACITRKKQFGSVRKAFGNFDVFFRMFRTNQSFQWLKPSILDVRLNLVRTMKHHITPPKVILSAPDAGAPCKTLPNLCGGTIWAKQWFATQKQDHSSCKKCYHIVEKRFCFSVSIPRLFAFSWSVLQYCLAMYNQEGVSLFLGRTELKDIWPNNRNAAHFRCAILDICLAIYNVIDIYKVFHFQSRIVKIQSRTMNFDYSEVKILWIMSARSNASVKTVLFTHLSSDPSEHSNLRCGSDCNLA